jgi:hypothetical protein
MKKTLLTAIAVLLACSAGALQARDVINLKGAEARTALGELQVQLAKAPGDFEANKSAGILLHQMSRSSPDKARVEEGEKYLKQASQLNPKDHETAAWLGSIITMKALFEGDPGKQTYFVKLGARAMDGAVQQAPDNLIVRLVRANNSLELPPFLKRSRFAVEDFQHYLALCERQTCPAAEVSVARTSLKAAQKLAADAQ